MERSEYIGGDYRIRKESVPFYFYNSRGPKLKLESGKMYTRRKGTKPEMAWLKSCETEAGGTLEDPWGKDYPPLLYIGEAFRWANNRYSGPYGSFEQFFIFILGNEKVCIERRNLRYMKYFTKHIKRTPLV